MKQDWQGRFALYDTENPHVYQAFKTYAYQLLGAGRTRGSAALIVERIRWDSAVRAEPEPGLPVFKINNSFRSFYVRKLLDECPQDFKNFFELREQKSLIAAQ